MVTFLIYLMVISEKLALMLGGLSSLIWVGGFGFLALAFICAMAGVEYSFDDSDKRTFTSLWLENKAVTSLKTVCKWCIGFGLAAYIISGIIPSQKEMAIIVAGSATYAAVTSEPAQRIGGKALDLLERKIDDAMADDVSSAPTENKAKGI